MGARRTPLLGEQRVQIAAVGEAVELDGLGGHGGVSALAKGHEPLDGLQVLASGLVVHDVGDTVGVDLLASGTLVDADHSDSDGPRGVSDRHFDVLVHRGKVVSLHAALHHHHQRSSDVVWKDLYVDEKRDQLSQVWKTQSQKENKIELKVLGFQFCYKIVTHR